MTRLFRLVGIAVLVAAGLVGTAPVAAVTFAVTRADDPSPDGCVPADCSLREAIVDADAMAGPDTIVLPAGSYTLSIPPDGTPNDGLDGDLDIADDLTIAGAGSATTIVDAGGIDRPFAIFAATAVSLSGLTVTGGDVSGIASGGGILNNGTVALTNSKVSANMANNPGGGIYNTGTVSLVNSTVSGNMSGAGGAGILNSGTATLTNSTISGNVSQAGNGGGMFNDSAATATLTNSTVSGNIAANFGGGIDNIGAASFTNSTVAGNTAKNFDAGGIGNFGTATLLATIVAGNTADDAGPDCTGNPLTSAGANVIGNTTDCTLSPDNPTDLKGADPLLGILQDNGGPTFTHALAAGSPALSHVAAPDCPGADQRGAPRSAPCDAGAYELVLCKGVVVNRVGTDGDDAITGTDGADGVLALEGNDMAVVRAGNDAVCAGGGNDTVQTEAGKDVAQGGSGNDRLNGGSGRDRLSGQTGKDRLNGGSGKDRCQGGPGRDRNRKCEKGKP